MEKDNIMKDYDKSNLCKMIRNWNNTHEYKIDIDFVKDYVNKMGICKIINLSDGMYTIEAGVKNNRLQDYNDKRVEIITFNNIAELGVKDSFLLFKDLRAISSVHDVFNDIMKGLF